MATVYKIEIETTSPRVNMNEQALAKIVKELLEEQLLNMKLENTTVNVIRIA